MSIRDRIVRRWATLRLSPTARRMRREGLTYLRPVKLMRIEAALRRLKKRRVAGDYLEFGVALGGTAALIAPAARRADATFVGLDVFSTIPPPTSEYDDAKSRERYAVIAAGAATGIGGETYYGYRDDLLDHVEHVLADVGAPVDGTNVRLEKGLFEDSWPTLHVDRVAFAHIDCDWHDPVRYCLDAVAPKLSDGGLIVIDDYHDYAGCRIAVDAFLAENPGFRMVPGANPLIERR
ncbi:TylF/MycF family methyltransferase [Sphingomonas sp. SUN019]|uniref:TylF/MycF family methyltransferase n=1 Tax=Sphingomonas sp. SUN019 TaxID=2937788 RepID=UPI002164251F|nr:TylF/MycF family methyltransferase [Sphingomonas sp. SUN019]UVO49039.1 TylF/MycF family methyltransferase [Sphingomonas sp. SUN019]